LVKIPSQRLLSLFTGAEKFCILASNLCKNY
jgi:hypothetical protein